MRPYLESLKAAGDRRTTAWHVSKSWHSDNYVSWCHFRLVVGVACRSCQWSGFLATPPTLRTHSDLLYTGGPTSWAMWNTSSVVVVAGVLAQFPYFF